MKSVLSYGSKYSYSYEAHLNCYKHIHDSNK